MKTDETQAPFDFLSQAQRLTDFVLQFDCETQEMWMRLFDLLTKQALTKDEAGELVNRPGCSGDCFS